MRLFAAVAPPDEVIHALEALERDDHPSLRWTTADQWHVTLRFLGEVADAGPVVADLAVAVKALAGPAPVARLGPATAVLGGHVLVLPAGGLDGLAAVLQRATASHGEPLPARPFSGHLTLARLRRGAQACVLRSLAGRPFEACFAVREVLLVRSRLHPSGARYEALAAFPLQGS